MATSRDDTSRIDATGTVHPIGREASQYFRARAGDWSLVPAPPGIALMRRTGTTDAVLKIAGEIRTPGGLCDVVALASQSQWIGELYVISEAGTRSFMFDRGQVIWATTTVPDERLGVMLLRFGVISEEQLERALQESNASGKRIGESAIGLSLVSPETLYPLMARQVEEVFYAGLHVSEGAFYFFDRFDERMIGRRFNLSAAGLMMEGLRRMDEMRFFRDKVPNRDYVPSKTNAAGKKAPDGTEKVFDAVDGKRTIAQIGDATGQLEFEVTKAVFQLIGAGVVQVTAPRPETVDAIVEVFNPAFAEIHTVSDAAGKGAILRDGLSRFATGAGIYDPLFMGAGPSTEGVFKAGVIARNVQALAGDDPESWLARLLYDYAGFALFQCESFLSREDRQSLARRVMELLKPVRPLIDKATRQ